MRMLRFPVLLTAPLVLAGCASEPTFGERLVAEGSAYRELGEQWTQGRRDVERGEDLVREGRRMIERGEDSVSRGRRLIREGEQAIAEAERTYQNSVVASN